MIQFDSTGLLSHSPRFNYYFIKFHVEDIDQYSKINFLSIFLILENSEKIYVYKYTRNRRNIDRNKEILINVTLNY